MFSNTKKCLAYISYNICNNTPEILENVSLAKKELFNAKNEIEKVDTEHPKREYCEALKDEVDHLRDVINRLIKHGDSHCSLLGPDGYLMAPEVDKIVAYNEIVKIIKAQLHNRAKE